MEDLKKAHLKDAAEDALSPLDDQGMEHVTGGYPAYTDWCLARAAENGGPGKPPKTEFPDEALGDASGGCKTMPGWGKRGVTF